MSQLVITVIGDLRASRQVKNRRNLQERLHRTLEGVNREHPHLLSPFTITLGDEFQAVYGRADRLFRDLWYIRAGIFPHQVRFAVGIGRLETPINPRQAIGMDGPAFHHARTAMEQLKRSEDFLILAGEQIPYLELANQSLRLVSHLSRQWSENRLQIFLWYLDELPVREMAARMGISVVAVYKNINAGALEVLRALQREIVHLLNQTVQP